MSGMHPSKSWLLSCKTKNRIAARRSKVLAMLGPNASGRPTRPSDQSTMNKVAPLDVELGIWPGRYRNLDLPWVRWWDAQGTLVPTSEERAAAAQEQTRLAQEQTRLAQERAERLAAQLRALGIEPD